MSSSPAGFALAATRGEWTLAPHLAILNEHLLAVAEGEIRRLAVYMPPRHGKSELISRFFPAWYVMRYHRRVLLSSYEARFAAWWGLQARELVREYGPIFDVELSRVLRQQTWWGLQGLEGHAHMATAGVGGPVTGKGGDVLVCDDPFKNAEEADSEVIRERNWRWWTRTWITRRQPGAALILVMTRWHEDDIGGRLEETTGDEWTVLKLPALAEERESWPILWPDPETGREQRVTWEREEGDPLWPTRFGKEELAEIRADQADERAWSALYQQQPVPEGGAIWHREWFQARYSYAKAQEALRTGGTSGLKRALGLSTIIQTADCANKTGATNDWSVIATWGKATDGRFYLLDVWRQRVEFPDLQDAAFDLYALWRPSAQHIEDAANGTPLIQALQARPSREEAMRRRHRWGFERIPVEAYQPDGDKVARARGVTPLARNGLVVLPDEAPWLEEWLREHERFPLGKHDDQCDTTAMGLEILRGGHSGRGYGFS